MSKIIVCENCGWINKFFDKDDPNNVFNICSDDDILDIIDKGDMTKSIARKFFKQILDNVELTKWWTVDDYTNEVNENKFCPVCRSIRLKIEDEDDFVSND